MKFLHANLIVLEAGTYDDYFSYLFLVLPHLSFIHDRVIIQIDKNYNMSLLIYYICVFDYFEYNILLLKHEKLKLRQSPPYTPKVQTKHPQIPNSKYH